MNTTSHQTAEETVQAFIRAFNAHDLDAVLACLAREWEAFGANSLGQRVGKEDWAKTWKVFEKALPDFKWEIVSMLSKGDTVACEMVETGTWEGSFDVPGHTLAPTNRSYTSPCAAFFRFNANGLIVEMREYADRLAWCQQVGIDPRYLLPLADYQTPTDEHSASRLEEIARSS
jgi:steroid delta-isomerase-like uncharacterized protein